MRKELPFPAWVAAFAVALALLGCIVRFTNLAAKGYTNDEATTSVHVAGHTVGDYYATVFDGRVRTDAQLQRFQSPDPGTTPADVVRGLAREDPQHPPLYYLLARGWAHAFGDGVAAKRSLSALAGILAVPALAWLGFELFGRWAPGALAGGLLAVSPFHVLYAQQAREYALWALLTALSSALLLRALRTRRAVVWCWYALALAAGLYTDALMLYVLVAHAVYAPAVERGRVRGFALAVLAALAAYAPWLAVLVAGARAGTVTNNTYLGAPLPPGLFALKWAFNAGAVFYDLDYRAPATAVLVLPLFGALAAAFVLLVRRTPVRQWLFVLALTGVSAGALLVPDLLRHESRSTSARYLVPAWLGLELALAWLLARAAVDGTGARRTLGIAGTWACAALGAVSCVVAGPLDAWWGDASVATLTPMVAAIAGADRPLVVYHASWGAGTSEPPRWDFVVPQLVDELPGTVRFQQFVMDGPAAIARWPGTVFVVDPSVRFRARLAAGGAVLVPVDIGSGDGPAALRGVHAQTGAALKRVGFAEAERSLWRLASLPAAPVARLGLPGPAGVANGRAGTANGRRGE